MGRATSRPAAGNPPAASPVEFTRQQILTILSGLLVGMFLSSLDQTIVSAAIRTIADDLNGLGQQAWTTTAYLITSTTTTPLYGKLSDMHGRKPYYLFAIITFIISSALCTLSTSMIELAAFRALQGIGAGGLMSLALAIIGDIVAPRERARYQGYILAVFASASVLGPLVGGFLAGQDTILGVTGWRWVFLVNVPVGLVALVIVARVLNLPHTRRRRRIDWWGAAAISMGVIPLLLVAEQGRDWGWTSARSIACYVIGVAGIAVWISVERRMEEDALIPVRLFRNPVFSRTSLAAVFIGMGMFGGTLIFPQYLQIVRGASPAKSGLELLTLMGGTMVSSISVGRIISKTGRYKIFPIIGTGLMAISMLLFRFTVQWDTPLWQPLACITLFGMGMGGCTQTLALAVQNAVSPREMGVATASATFFRQMGSTAGTAIFLSVLFSTVGGNIASSLRGALSSAAFQEALRDPAVLRNPENAPVLALARNADSGNTSSLVLGDSSFIQKLDSRLAVPFKQGFTASIHESFLLGAVVLFLGFLVFLSIQEVPLRKVSGLQAQAAEAVSAAGAAVPEVTSRSRGRGRHARPRTIGLPGVRTRPAETVETVSSAPAKSAGGPVSVQGTVRDGSGVPVSGAFITLIDDEGRQVERSTTATDGRYVLPGIGVGSYLLIGTGEARQPAAVSVIIQDAPVDCDLVLIGTVALSGEVARLADEQPLPGALVVATDQRGWVVASGKAGLDGSFNFSEMVPGTYTLAVSAWGHQPTAVPAGIDSSGPNRFRILLESASYGTFGTLYGREDVPLDDVWVVNSADDMAVGPDGEAGLHDWAPAGTRYHG